MTASGDEATDAPGATPGGDAPAPGLRALYVGLAAVVERHRLDAFAVVVDDPELGRQAFAAGPRAETALTVLADDARRSWCTVPLSDDVGPEVELVRALARTALRLACADPAADPSAALEARLRALPEVRAVMRRGALLEITPRPGRHDALASHLAALDLPGGGIVVLRGDPRVDSGADSNGPGAAPGAGERVELVAVRTLPERGELEIHLRSAQRRTVGRAPLSRAAAGAAAATLDALGALEALDQDPRRSRRWHVGWVRTIDTTADRAFLVAVAIRRDDAATLYGIAEGTSPVDAAARATLHACNRVVGRRAGVAGPAGATR